MITNYRVYIKRTWLGTSYPLLKSPSVLDTLVTAY